MAGLGKADCTATPITKLLQQRSLGSGEEEREKGHSETWPEPQRQAEGSFKEHGSILKIMDRLNLRTDKERSLDFGKWLLGF